MTLRGRVTWFWPPDPTETADFPILRVFRWQDYVFRGQAVAGPGLWWVALKRSGVLLHHGTEVRHRDGHRYPTKEMSVITTVSPDGYVNVPTRQGRRRM